jgi:hypothetical protein
VYSRSFDFAICEYVNDETGHCRAFFVCAQRTCTSVVTGWPTNVVHIKSDSEILNCIQQCYKHSTRRRPIDTALAVHRNTALKYVHPAKIMEITLLYHVKRCNPVAVTRPEYASDLESRINCKRVTILALIHATNAFATRVTLPTLASSRTRLTSAFRSADWLQLEHHIKTGIHINRQPIAVHQLGARKHMPVALCSRLHHSSKQVKTVADSGPHCRPWLPSVFTESIASGRATHLCNKRDLIDAPTNACCRRSAHDVHCRMHMCQVLWKTLNSARSGRCLTICHTNTHASAVECRSRARGPSLV